MKKQGLNAESVCNELIDTVLENLTGKDEFVMRKFKRPFNEFSWVSFTSNRGTINESSIKTLT